MARSVNKIILVGNVGRDPDIQITKTGTKVAHVSLATNRKVNGDEEERTEWHRLTMWNRLAEITEEHVHRGDRIYVEGTLEYDSYEREGIRIPTVDVMVRDLVLLTRKGEEVGASAT